VPRRCIETISELRDLKVSREDKAAARQRLGAVIDPLRAAREDYDAVVTLTRELVRVPSRGGIDPYDPVLECMAARLGEHGLASCRLAGPGGATVALTCEVPGGRPGPRYVLDACLDTAPFGDEATWTYPPASGEIAGGWLHGRGSSDSKAGPRSSPTSLPGCGTRRAGSAAAWCCCSTLMSTPGASAARKPTSRVRALRAGLTG